MESERKQKEEKWKDEMKRRFEEEEIFREFDEVPLTKFEQMNLKVENED